MKKLRAWVSGACALILSWRCALEIYQRLEGERRVVKSLLERSRKQ